MYIFIAHKKVWTYQTKLGIYSVKMLIPHNFREILQLVLQFSCLKRFPKHPNRSREVNNVKLKLRSRAAIFTWKQTTPFIERSWWDVLKIFRGK